MKNVKRKNFREVRARNEMKKIIQDVIFVTIITLVMIMFGVVFFLSRILIKGDNISSVNGYSAQVIISGSMVPTLEVYDVIVVKQADNYQIGDIITFYVPDEQGNMVSYTHRIVSVGEGTYMTQGDNNQEWDDFTVYRQNVVGTIEYRIPKVGKWVLKFSEIPIDTYKTVIIAAFSVLILFIISDTIKAATAEFTKKELQLLELSEHKKFNFKVRMKIKALKLKKIIQTKIMKRQI